MVLEQEDKISRVLEHPTTLKLFIYLRSKTKEDIGVRETQRAVSLKSPSTAVWHLDKLEEAGLIEKLPSTLYRLSQEGKQLYRFQIPIRITTHFIRGFLIPRSAFQLSFIISMIISTFILVWFYPLLAAINGLLGMCVIVFISFSNLKSIENQMRFYAPKDRKKT
ncbi:MAG: helix-turn-helix transcriptional regulator [Asgard group archaeon]|nr:helix-turn-helix transcriptional regulator [Asgard group archaeon]